MSILIKYSPDFDRLSAQEHTDLDKSLKSVQKFIEHSSKISKVSYATRDAHAKTYAMATAQLQISEGLPPFISRIFNQSEYEVLTRFSNGNLVINKKGRENPLYGFSLKIKNVQGRDANFPLVNFPLFPTNSPSVFLKFFNSVNTFLVTKQDNFLVSFMDLPHLIKNAFSLVSNMFSADVTRRIFKLLLHRNDFFFSFDYAGIGCYRLGDHIMKISLKPINISPKIAKKEPQKKSIPAFLATRACNFRVIIQMSENLKDQPVNDLMRDWKNAPEYILGILKIPKNSLIVSDSSAVENLNFDPFANSEQLQPVGKIQQIRKKVYQVSIESRNLINKIKG